MLTELSLSTRILDTRQLPMSIVTIRAALCKKCTVDASEPDNDIGLLRANIGQSAPWGICSYGPHWCRCSFSGGGAFNMGGAKDGTNFLILDGSALRL